jgi:hypothetical protein
MARRRNHQYFSAGWISTAPDSGHIATLDALVA